MKPSLPRAASILAGALALAGLSVDAFAGAYWFQPDPRDGLLKARFVDERGVTATKPQTLSLSKAWAIQPGARAKPLRLESAGAFAFAAPSGACSVSFESGGSEPTQSSKTLLLWTRSCSKPDGSELEIIPLAFARPRKGSYLPVRVLWRSRPLPGAAVELPGGLRVVADDTGKASIPVGSKTQILVARPPASPPPGLDPKRSAVLAFEPSPSKLAR